MSKVKSHKNEKKKRSIFFSFSPLQQQIFAIIFITAAIVLILGLFNLAGIIGEFLVLGLEILFGAAKWFVPIVLLIAGLLSLNYYKFKEGDLRIRFRSRFLGLVLLVAVLAGVLHIYFVDDKSALQNFQGGGYIGYGLSYIVVGTFGFWASWVVFAGIFAVLMVIVFGDLIKARQGKSDEEVLTEENSFRRILKRILLIFKKKKKMVIQSEVIETAEKTRESESIFTRIKIKKEKKGEEKEFLTAPPKVYQRVNLPFNLLEQTSTKPNAGDIRENKEIIKKTLESFSIPVEMGEVKVGPTVTQYTLKPAEGIKLSQITALHNDLAMALAAHPIRIEAPIPGQSLVGIEVPNQKVAIIRLREILDSEVFKKRKSNLTLALGRDVSGNIWLADLGKMPHLLVAGATGSGKTIFLNSVIISLVYQNFADELRFILVDPKKVELTLYNNLAHLLTPVITEVDKTINALKWAITEMERRFEIMSEAKKRDISAYNQANPDKKLSYIVIIVDELADLMMTAPHEVEGCIIRLTQMARATGIHLVMATQRPSVDIITGLIKANITSRVAFSVASAVDSRTILDFAGAEKLLGRGDMLFISPEISKPRRLQGAYVSDEEVGRLTEYLAQGAEYNFNQEIIEPQSSMIMGSKGELKEDEMLPQAREVILQIGKASASLLQRRLRIGYARAARLLDLLEEEGTIGPADGAKPREVYTQSSSDEEY